MYPLPNRAELLVPDARQAERETATRASMPPALGVRGRSLQCDAAARRGRRRRVKRPGCTAVPRRTVLGGPVRACVRRHDPTCHRCRTRTGQLPRDAPARGPRSRAVRRVSRRRHPDPPGVNESETPYGLVMFRRSDRVPVSLLVLTVLLALTVGGESCSPTAHGNSPPVPFSWSARSHYPGGTRLESGWVEGRRFNSTSVILLED